MGWPDQKNFERTPQVGMKGRDSEHIHLMFRTENARRPVTTLKSPLFLILPLLKKQ